MTKLLWHSNAPWSPTGYGQQTGLIAPHLAKHYELAISSFYGLEGAPMVWDGIPVLPGVAPDYGNLSIVPHARQVFDGDLRGGLVVTLMDVWVLDPRPLQQLNVACWCPVDHTPAPPKVVEFFMHSGAVPIVMSEFGLRMLGRLDPLYVPHAVDTSIYKPRAPMKIREQAELPQDAFVVGMVAANKGRPSRKGFAQAFQAFGRFADEHDDAYLYLHTTWDGSLTQGEDIQALLDACGVPMDRVRGAGQYEMMFKPYSANTMAGIFSALDVLVNPSMGEGFGIPALEAQACGVPVIVSDNTAMSEVGAVGWKVPVTPHWTGQSSWQGFADVASIYAALEECYARSDDEVGIMSVEARAHAHKYDVHRVMDEHMLPALETIEQRFEARKPVTLPPWHKMPIHEQETAA